MMVCCRQEGCKCSPIPNPNKDILINDGEDVYVIYEGKLGLVPSTIGIEGSTELKFSGQVYHKRCAPKKIRR